MCFRVFELEMIYFFFFLFTRFTIIPSFVIIGDCVDFGYHLSIIYGRFSFLLIRCTILMADRKTEGILSSEILDGFIKLEER